MSVGFLIAGLESFQNNLGFNVEDEFMIGRELNHGSVFPEHRIEFVGARDVRKRRLGEWCAISLIEVAFIPVQNCLFKQEASSAFYFDSVLIVRHNIWIFHRSKIFIPFPICAHLLGYLRLYLVPLLAQTLQSCRFNNFSCWKGPS